MLFCFSIGECLGPYLYTKNESKNKEHGHFYTKNDFIIYGNTLKFLYHILK